MTVVMVGIDTPIDAPQANNIVVNVVYMEAMENMLN